jgi:hypothetical protein
MLDLKVIKPIESDWSSPCFLAPKKNAEGEWAPHGRFVIDVRGLNSVTKKIIYPTTRIEDILNKIRNAKYYTTLDFSAGYWQIPMTDNAMKKSTFICREGMYAPTVMPFGLTNAPAVFIKLLDTILADLKYDTCLAYVDDIIVWSETEEEHLLKLTKLFDRLSGENLKLKPTKCHLMYLHLIILGVK